MFDILCERFRDPGRDFSPMPFWFWNDRLEQEELLRQIDDFHKKGVDGFVLHPRMGMQVEGGYLSEPYFDLVEACLEAAKRRRMRIVLYDEAMYPSGSAHGSVAAYNPLFAARCLVARPAGTPLAEGEEVVLRLALTFAEDGVLLHAAGAGEEIPADAVWYDFDLSFTGGTIRGLSPAEDDGQPAAPLAADLLNPAATEVFLQVTHEAYAYHVGAYFGDVVIGFFTDEPSLTGRNPRKDAFLSWTYDFLPLFREAGGTDAMLAAMLFPAKDKRLVKDGHYALSKALRRRLRDAYYIPLSHWCQAHGLALLGHPASSQDMLLAEAFDVPGQDLVWRMVEPGTELSSPDSPLAKCAADAARHTGAARCSCECLGACAVPDAPIPLESAEMLWYFNFLFARGINMLIPHAFYYSQRTPLQREDRPPDVGPHSYWWSEYRTLSGYCKRLSWLNSACTDNPAAAVLADDGILPVEAVRCLYTHGISFHYLTMDELLRRARVIDGEIRIDRYRFRTLLIDSRLRLCPEVVRVIGDFVTQGGRMYRESDFSAFCRSAAAKPAAYFDAQSPAIRFVHLTKSGHPFYLVFNEGATPVTGHVVTNTPGAAFHMDPFTGKIEPQAGEIVPDGFSYPLTVAPWSVSILGMDADRLPLLTEAASATETETLREICALSPARPVFSLSQTDNTVVRLVFHELHGRADVTVNGEAAGVVLYRPFTLDITALCHTGENVLSWTLSPAAASAANVRVEISTVC